MKLVILLLAVVITMAMTSCQPCEGTCKFNDGDEITIKSKNFTNNGGIVSSVERHNDCSCYYMIQHSNMINFTNTRSYEEHEIK